MKKIFSKIYDFAIGIWALPMTLATLVFAIFIWVYLFTLFVIDITFERLRISVAWKNYTTTASKACSRLSTLFEA